MFFQGEKACNRGPVAKVSIKDAKEFEKTMQRLSSNIYACLVNFVGKIV
jgi:hypothetical protein